MGQIVGGAAKPKRCNLNKLSQLGVPAAGEHILVSSDNSMNAAGQGNFDCYIVGDGQKAAAALELKFIGDFGVNDYSDADLVISDNNGNALVVFRNGGIKTKNFDSENLQKSHWKGKKWYGFGTSITNTSNEGKYATYLAQISGLNFVNKGHSGGGITTSSNQSIYNDIMSADLSDADLITLEIGANDTSAPLGSIYDGLPTSDVQTNVTFCGALNLCLRHLLSTTNAQIVVIASPNGRYQYQHPKNVYYGNETYSQDGHTILDRNEVMRKVCILNSCYFINAGGEDGMGYARMNASNLYNVDQIHHTNLGGYNFAHAIWSKLSMIPLFYTSIQ